MASSARLIIKGLAMLNLPDPIRSDSSPLYRAREHRLLVAWRMGPRGNFCCCQIRSFAGSELAQICAFKSGIGVGCILVTGAVITRKILNFVLSLIKHYGYQNRYRWQESVRRVTLRNLVSLNFFHTSERSTVTVSQITRNHFVFTIAPTVVEFPRKTYCRCTALIPHEISLLEARNRARPCRKSLPLREAHDHCHVPSKKYLVRAREPSLRCTARALPST